MNYELNTKAFLKGLPLAEMSGHQKFLAVAALLGQGKTNIEVTTKRVQEQWSKSLLGIPYNSVYYDRAQQEGWVNPVSGRRGELFVAQDGLDHLSALPGLESEFGAGELKQAGGLIVVNRKATHTFDKLLRRILAEAKAHVFIADSWVDESVFDNVFDVIPKSIPVKLLYAQARGSFDQRAKRFSIEYQKFFVRRYKPLHDRFIIVDDSGYILGPSIKDAASNSPALVVALGTKEKRLLQSFFDELWKKGKATT